MKRDLEFVVEHESLRVLLRSTTLWAVVLAVIAILAAYRTTADSIVAIWIRSETFAHGFVVIPICAWLAWRKRDELAALELRPWWPGIAGVLLCGALWLVAAKAGAVVVQQFALAFMLQAAIVSIIGLGAARVLAFPLVFLLFAVPAGEFLVPTLMDWTAAFVVRALRATGVPVYQEANHFVIPSGSWSVVEACSGIRYVIASVMVGTIYAAIAYRSALRRILFVAASILVPIVANWLRAYMIVLLGHLSNNRIATGIDHVIYGWIFFGLVMLLVFWIGSFWQESKPAAPARIAWSPAPGIFRASHAASLAIVALVAVAAAVIWRPVDAAIGRRIATGEPVLQKIASANPWTPSRDSGIDWTPQYEGYAASLRQGFTDGRRDVYVYIAYYRRQSKGHELITSENVLTKSGNWKWKAAAQHGDVVDWDGRQTRVDRVQLSGETQRIDAVSLYWIAGSVTSNAYVAKALQAWANLTGRGDDAALVVLYTPTSAGGAGSPATLRAFATAMSPSIDTALQRTQETGR